MIADPSPDLLARAAQVRRRAMVLGQLGDGQRRQAVRAMAAGLEQNRAAILAANQADLEAAAAEGLAKRALEAVGVSPEATIGYAFSVALSRQPQPEEQAQFLNLFQARQQAAGGDQAKSAAVLADICQLLFCLNEFVYVD